MALSTLEQFPWGLLYTVVLYICISDSLILVLIYRYRFENIHLLHTYYIIIVYLQNKVITLCFEQHTSVTGTTLKTTPETHNWHNPSHYISKFHSTRTEGLQIEDLVMWPCNTGVHD